MDAHSLQFIIIIIIVIVIIVIIIYLFSLIQNHCVRLYVYPPRKALRIPPAYTFLRKALRKTPRIPYKIFFLKHNYCKIIQKIKK